MIKTPIRPTRIAIQRRQPAHSPSSGPASAVISIGEKNEIDCVWASCRVSRAKKLKIVEPNRKALRSTWRGRLLARIMRGLRQGRKKASTRTTWPTKRAHETNTALMPPTTRYLALVSRQEKARPAAMTSRIAEPGVALSRPLL